MSDEALRRALASMRRGGTRTPPAAPLPDTDADEDGPPSDFLNEHESRSEHDNDGGPQNVASGRSRHVIRQTRSNR